MNSKEILTNIKELVGLAKAEPANEIEVVEETVLSTEEVTEEVIEEKVEEVVEASTEEATEEVVEEVVVEASEETKEEVIEEETELEEEPKEEKEQPMPNYATQDELSALKSELLAMMKTMMEDKSDYSEADVPAELSTEEKEDVELSEEVEEEVVHSPESVTEKRNINPYVNKQPMTTAQRVAWMINN